MDLQEIIQQYREATLPKLIEKQLKSLDEDTLLQAIRGTYEYFPIEFRPQVDAYTLAYSQKWLVHTSLRRIWVTYSVTPFKT